MRRSIWSLTVTAAVVSAAAFGCATADRGVPGQPLVQQEGRYVVHYDGPELEAAVGYQFAANNLGEPWLIIDVALSGQDRTALEVEREGVAVLTPDGRRVELWTQAAFAEQQGELRPVIRRASIGRDPLDYFPGTDEPCGEWFFSLPTEGLAYDALYLTDREICQGFLFFEMPGGVQAGSYELEIQAGEETARIPFELGAGF